MAELSKKRNPGILDYDPKKKRPSMEQIQCPYCWFAHHAKNIVSRHVNKEHWAEKND